MGEVPGSIPGTAPYLCRYHIYVLLMESFYCVRREMCNSVYSDARLAQSVERKTLNLVVVGSSPTMGVIFSVAAA